VCYIDLEPCQVWTETQRKARKKHKCDCCGRVIKPGETYTRNFNKFDGVVSYSKGCAECIADRLTFAKAHSGQLFPPDSLKEMLEQCIYDDEDDGDDDGAYTDPLRWHKMLDAIRERGKPGRPDQPSLPEMK
jgi:hypothetical protein